MPVIIGGGFIRPRPTFNRLPPAPGQVVRKLAAPAEAGEAAKMALFH